MGKEYLAELLEEFIDFLKMKEEELVEEEVLEEDFVEPEQEESEDEAFSAMLGDIAKGE